MIYFTIYEQILYICFTIYIIMSKLYLGEFEEMVLTMVAVLGEDAYGNPIVQEFQNRLGREVSLSAVHLTLYRLEDKGLVASRLGGSTQERGGRRKRMYTISSAGVELLRTMKEARSGLWKFIPTLNS